MLDTTLDSTTTVEAKLRDGSSGAADVDGTKLDSIALLKMTLEATVSNDTTELSTALEKTSVDGTALGAADDGSTTSVLN